MYAKQPERIRLLRDDIRRTIKKQSGAPKVKGKGGDFYVPFWADAKQHVRGKLDLRKQAQTRIDANRGRARLYDLLVEGFLSWWEERRRLRNEPFTVLEENIHVRFDLEGLGAVKVENTLSIRVGDDGRRLIYPYFIEDPALSDEAARLGLWLMSRCVATYDVDQIRILDVIRGRTFSVLDTPLTGDEEAIFRKRYAELQQDWQRLRAKYL
jgi:hypothetical protein